MKTISNGAKSFTTGLLLTVVSLTFSIKVSAQTQMSEIPLPAEAQPREMPKEGYILQKAGKNSYVVIGGVVQACFVVTPAGVVVVDAPPALAEKLPAAIKSVTDKPVVYVIQTHHHFDHIGAITLFKGAKTIAHEETAKLLKLYPDPKRPAPSFSFAGEHYSLSLGGQEIRLIYPGPNHEDGNIIVYVPADKLVILNDVVIPGWAPFRGWGNADYIPGILKAMDAVLKLDFDTFVGGHIYRTGTRADVEDSRAYFIDLWKETKAEMAATPFDVHAFYGNVWLAQKDWFDKIADRVSTRLVKKWQGKLGATDTFTHETVVSVVVSMITDTTVIPEELLK